MGIKGTKRIDALGYHSRYSIDAFGLRRHILWLCRQCVISAVVSFFYTIDQNNTVKIKQHIDFKVIIFFGIYIAFKIYVQPSFIMFEQPKYFIIPQFFKDFCMKINKLPTLGLLMLGLGASAAASAGVITQNFTLPLTTTNWSSSFSVQQFDTLGGTRTLNSIGFTLGGTVQGWAGLESLDNAPASLTGALQATLTLTRPDLSTIAVVIPSADVSFSASAFDGATDFGGTSGVMLTGLNNSASVGAMSPPPASDLLLFTGLGIINLPISAAGNSSATGAGNLVAQFNTQALADLTVVYNYSTTAVPEPASLAIMGLGFLGLAAVRRKKMPN